MSKIVVIKIGTTTVTKGKGSLDLGVMQRVAEQSKELQNRGYKVVIVSSGAIGCGVQSLNLQSYPTYKDIALKQLCAGVGQVELMKTWKMVFDPIVLSQHLVIHATFQNPDRIKDFRRCIFLALEKGIIPIINENDPIATEEIDEKFSDNDELAVLVAKSTKAEKLIILSDIEGLFTDNPKSNPEAKIIKKVENIDSYIFSLANGKSDKGRGGMQAKLQAIKSAIESGITVYLTHGKKEGAIEEVFSDDFTGTVFG